MTNTEHQRLGNQIKILLEDFSKPKAQRMTQRLHKLEADGDEFPTWLDDLWEKLTNKIEENNASHY